MDKKRMADKKSSAILTRSRKAKLNANSDPQPLTVLTLTFDSASDHQPPKSKKAKTHTSGASTSMAPKKKESTHQGGKIKLDSPSDPQPPKSKKAKTNTSDGPSKKKANIESSTIVTESSTRQRGKAKVDTNSDSKKAKTITTSDAGSNRRGKEILKSPLAVTEKPNFKKPKTPPKKMANVVQSSSSTVVTRSGKRKAKVDSNVPSNSDSNKAKELVKSPLAVAQTSKKSKTPPKKMANVESSSSGVVTHSAKKGKAKLESKKMENVQNKGKAKEEDSISSKKPKLTISEEKANVQISSVVTRRGKAKMGSDPEPPKSKKAKGTTATASSTLRGKAKIQEG
ncbi:hypothetical protein P3S68_019064 [Capsicum galapagoense]